MGRDARMTMRGPMAGALAMALVAAGCGAPGPGRRSAWEPAAQLPTFDVNAVPREQLRTGGTLRWPIPELPRQWNLAHADVATGRPAAGGAAGEVLPGLMPYVMRCDEKGVPHPDPDYVTDVRLSRRAGRQVVTYTLNRRAVWSDGSPITYRDYAAQARALSGRGKRLRLGSVAGYDHVAKAERGSDDHQVIVSFARPLADWPELFSPLYPAATNSDPAAFDTGWLDRIGATAGPFAVESYDRRAKTITVARNPRWWGRRAVLDRIVYRAMDGAEVTRAFAAGQVDLMDLPPDAAAYRRAAEVKGAVIRTAGDPGWRALLLNATRPPLSDVRLRQALAFGLDRPALTASGFGDLNWPRPTLDNHFFVNTQAGYQDNSGELGMYIPDRARRLLDEAGWRESGDHRVKNGEILQLRLGVSADPQARHEAELIQGMLRPLGVRSVIQATRGRDTSSADVPPGDVDLAAFSSPGTPFPLSRLWPLLAQPHGGRGGRTGTTAGSAAIGQAMDRALCELDPVKARRLTNDADRLVWQQARVLPLYQRPQLVAARSVLANLGARGFYDPAYEDIGFTV
ncbi:MAG: extracellular solute-binding protein family 5 [Streptosporangiaceae bacterium]|nr:extracellular solute-binding protein family 5 [Streptosporangiaceae bacterium]